MAEYIEREALLGWLLYEYEDDPFRDFEDAVKFIEDAPAADVVAVVRCENCKRAKVKEYEVFCNLMCAYLGKNDFCSYGEKREEE